MPEKIGQNLCAGQSRQVSENLCETNAGVSKNVQRSCEICGGLLGGFLEYVCTNVEQFPERKVELLRPSCTGKWCLNPRSCPANRGICGHSFSWIFSCLSSCSRRIVCVCQTSMKIHRKLHQAKIILYQIPRQISGKGLQESVSEFAFLLGSVRLTANDCVGVMWLQGQEKESTCTRLSVAKDGPSRTPFLGFSPQIPRKRSCGLQFCFPRNEAENIWSGGPNLGIEGGGLKGYVDKYSVLFPSLTLNTSPEKAGWSAASRVGP